MPGPGGVRPFLLLEKRKFNSMGSFSLFLGFQYMTHLGAQVSIFGLNSIALTLKDVLSVALLQLEVPSVSMICLFSCP